VRILLIACAKKVVIQYVRADYTHSSEGSFRIVFHEEAMSAMTIAVPESRKQNNDHAVAIMKTRKDVYFSADIETDGPIPGEFSMLSFAFVAAGAFDGEEFSRSSFETNFYRELRPISENFQQEALAVNGLDRGQLLAKGGDPALVMTEASDWIRAVTGDGNPILVAFPLSFDWSWLYWYFVKFARGGSPFNHSLCYDVKTAYAVKAAVPISEAGKSKMLPSLRPQTRHTHHALEDAVEQAEIFVNVFMWEGNRARTVARKT
jgi:hypothetical protein